MKKGPQLLFYVLIALMLVSMFRLFSSPPTDEIPYSDFKTLVTEKKVQDLIISRDHIRGIRMPERDKEEKGKPFSTVRIEERHILSRRNLGQLGPRFASHLDSPARRADPDLEFRVPQDGRGRRSGNVHEFRQIPRENVR
jgi:ATP-dependent Zn protease